MKFNHHNLRRTLFTAAVMAAAMLCVGQFESGHTQTVKAATAPAPGEKIAVVNISGLLRDLDEQVHNLHQFNKLQASVEAKLKAKQTALHKMAEPLNPNSTLAVKPGTEEFNHLEKKVQKAIVEYQVYRQYSRERLHAHLLNMSQDVYSEIAAAIAAYAKAHGIALVLEKNPIEHNLTSMRNYVEMVQTRSVLYAARSVDITDKIAAAMNRAWTKAHGG